MENASDRSPSTVPDQAGRIIPLHELRERDLAEAGPKAVRLGQAIRAGLPVPPGFVITASLLRSVIDSDRRLKASEQAIEKVTQISPAAADEASRPLRTALAVHPLAPEFEQAILAACQAWPQVELWAVRSSGVCEDLAKASFAGQHDSFLNVEKNDLVDRVRRCWMSLFSPRAILYRVHHRIPHSCAGMAVLVQQMVRSDLAGVLFTADPATGDANRVIIEAARGLGEGVVSGRARTETIILEKGSPKILERVSAVQTSEMSKANSALPEVELISDRLALRLCELSRKTERIFPGPLDIEWAAENEAIFLLQARPITSAARQKTWEERQVWVNVNSGEVLPDVATPITWSLICHLLGPLLHSIFHVHGADLGQNPVIGLVAGRLYFNANTGLAALAPYSRFLKRIRNFAEALGGMHIALTKEGEMEIPKEDLPDLGFRWRRFISRLPLLLWTILQHSPRRGDAWTDALQKQSNPLIGLDLDTMPVPELLRLLAQLVRDDFQKWDLFYLVTQAATLPVFQKACTDWLDDADLALGYKLFAALGGIPETEAALALWQLAVLARTDPETQRIVLAQTEPQEGSVWMAIRAQLKQSDHGREFLRAWKRFMAEHGHHCRGELELHNPRWAETPDYILGVLRGYIQSSPAFDAVDKQRRLAAEREALTQECRRRLKNPIKRWIFNRALARAQKLAINREVWKDQAIRHLTRLRQLLLALGNQFQRSGALSRADDLFFLDVEELLALADRASPEGTISVADSLESSLAELRPVILQRREEYEGNARLNPPAIVRGLYDPRTDPGFKFPSDQEVLHGIPIYPGIVSGSARVILRSDHHEQVLPGEILVAPFTDPAWTPYFITAAGVIIDQGGILSHGSIIAREYGLPAVTNVGCATRSIRTGDRVQLDGAAGRVTILARAPSATTPG